METPKLDFFLGTIREVKDRLTYEVTVDVPGLGEELRAYPFSRGEMDEPVAGNLVYLLSIDPMYHSVFLYIKAKENDFIGIRSNGKAIDITPDYITVGTYDTSKTHEDSEHPDCSNSFLKMDSSGNIEIMAKGNETVKISGNATIEVSGNVYLTTTDCTVNASKVEIAGGAGSGLVPPKVGGPMCGIPNCLFTSAPHQGSVCQ